MPYYSDDPLMDFHRHDRDQAKWLEDLPVCCECTAPIQEEKAVCVDGKWYCSDCELDAWAVVRSHYMEDTNQY